MAFSPEKLSTKMQIERDRKFKIIENDPQIKKVIESTREQLGYSISLSYSISRNPSEVKIRVADNRIEDIEKRMGTAVTKVISFNQCWQKYQDRELGDYLSSLVDESVFTAPTKSALDFINFLNSKS